ncbi:unnamed protein product [Paramecium sonneborni]|uniref:Transmembrane protein n=1 Tax=Paramecium sonneborni TaxID=65129 RepID=A0A8S1PTX3_9CILI|nr:unnamed protein product [Paramecium sonneborni]
MQQEYIRLIIHLPRYFYMQLDVQIILVKLHGKLQEHVLIMVQMQLFLSIIIVLIGCTVNYTNNASIERTCKNYGSNVTDYTDNSCSI